MLVIKRNGTEVDFNTTKIVHAIQGANNEVEKVEMLPIEVIACIAEDIEGYCSKIVRTLNVEEIQDLVESKLMKYSYPVARRYIRYRYDKEKIRQGNTTDAQILTLVEGENEEVKQENSNKNPTIIPTQRDYIAGEVSKDISRRMLLPQDVIKAHDEGIIHFHDMDYFVQRSYNCCLINLDDMLQNGTVISGTMIEKPHTFSTACNIATQIIAQVASSQYGGQSITLSHLAPFVQSSREKFTEKYKELKEALGSEEFNKLIERMVQEDIVKGVQTIQYQVVTLMTTNGQAPFITVFMNINEVPEGQVREDLVKIIEEVLNQRIAGVKNECGVTITPAFPKLIYLLDDNNAYPNTEYWYLTQLAIKCSAKRMVPDYISAKKMRELKEGDVYTCMGCRSFLTPDRFSDIVGNISKAKNFEQGKHKYYGRFNQGVVTINLVDVALSSGGDKEAFWKILEERLSLCYKALMCRHNRLKGTVSDVAPILWQYGALARLEKGEKIDNLLFNGYSTISLGYAGLYECTKYMTGKSHTDPEGRPFALSVMQSLTDHCTKWKEDTNIDFSVYGTPLESTTYKFAKCLQNRFGKIADVTDHNYITNSYHVNVREEIDAFTKLAFEADFQALSQGGAISYVEVPNLNTNIEALETVVQFIYENIMYAEVNTKSDYCQTCGYEGEIRIVEDNNKKLIWECPNCGNKDQSKMNVARRTCGYIGTNYWNQGRTQEIAERVLHL